MNILYFAGVLSAIITTFFLFYNYNNKIIIISCIITIILNILCTFFSFILNDIIAGFLWMFGTIIWILNLFKIIND